MIVTDIPVRLAAGSRCAVKSGAADPRESNTPAASASCRPFGPSRLSRNAIPAHPMLVVTNTLLIPYPCRRSEYEVPGATCAPAEQLATWALPAPTRVGLAAATAAMNATVTRTTAGTAADLQSICYTPP